ncbi:PilZ domain-containing protein [Fodinisporobacter ferrooxydans]|uniref:PilZ domain-containing protein n=1 Tax=Fodinisporobacter ferrooxydans TaxID=2901836 RepID=A0ABY4CIA6_9BACL|nr:PilZ domain-containing protein [Alicyclobacillaceae bacterium MYW30-H2]
MALPRVGQTVFLDVRSGPLAGRYQCRVVDHGQSTLSIETPLRLNSTVPVTFDVGIDFEVVYRALDGAECRFFSNVVKRVVKEIPVLEIYKPKMSAITRIQRREYLRVPINIPVELAFLDSYTKRPVTCKGMSKDISGGGLAFTVESSISVHAEDVIGFRFTIPIDGSMTEVLGKGIVLRVLDLSEKNVKKVISVRFFDISDQNRQRIVRFTFQRQIEISKKLDQL